MIKLLRVLRPFIFLASILVLIWIGAGMLMDMFWCTGCSRSMIATQTLIALTFLVGIVGGLTSAAWAQVLIERDAKRADLLRRAQEESANVAIIGAAIDVWKHLVPPRTWRRPGGQDEW